MYRKLSFEKFKNAIKVMPGEEVKNEENKHRKLLLKFFSTESKPLCVKDVDWDSFTLEELESALSYAEEQEVPYSKASRLVEAIRNFEREPIKTSDIF